MLIDGANGQTGCGEFCCRCQTGDTAADDENVEDFDGLYDAIRRPPVRRPPYGERGNA